uniref:RAP domain-containing protein n=1 Tax=Syphacia muris TaxID=451379 RepID=A0A0N5A8F2_9BILA
MNFRLLSGNYCLQRQSFLVLPACCLTSSSLLSKVGICRHDRQQLNSTYSFARQDFIGVTKTGKKSSISAENIIALLMHNVSRNFRLKSQDFLDGLVVPLEAGNPSVLKLLHGSNELVPRLIGYCGRAMSDLSCKDRQSVLDRFWAALLAKDFLIDINAFNSRLSVFLENDYNFPVWETLVELKDFHLLPNATTFAALLARSSIEGDLHLIRKLALKAERFNIDLGVQTCLANIRALALTGKYDDAELCMKESLQKFDEEYQLDCTYAYALGVAANSDTKKLQKIMKATTELYSLDSDVDRNMLSFSYSQLFEILWELSKTWNNKESLDFFSEFLDYASRQTGFFKYLIREIDRHVLEHHYAAALLLVREVFRIRGFLERQNRDQYLFEIIGRFAHTMIMGKEPMEKINTVLRDLRSFIGDRIVYEHNFLYDALTCKHLNVSEKLVYFNGLIKTVDRKCTRPHLILPIIINLKSLSEKLKALEVFTSLGYKDISLLHGKTMNMLLLKPLFKEAVSSGMRGAEILDFILHTLEKCGFHRKGIWNTLLKFQRDLFHDIHSSVMDRILLPSEFAEWLKKLHNEINMENERLMSYSFIDMMNCFCSSDLSKASLMLKTSRINFTEENKSVFKAFLNNLVRKPNYIELSELFHSLSKSNELSAVVENFHLIYLLTKRVESVQKLDDLPLSYVQELSFIFPLAVSKTETMELTVEATKNFIDKCFSIEPLKENNCQCILSILKELTKTNILELTREEEITVFLLSKVMKNGVEDCIQAMLFCQAELDSINSLYPVLKDAITSRNQDTENYGIIFKMIIETEAIRLAVLCEVGMFERARAISAEIKPDDAVWSFKLLNKFLPVETETFTKLKANAELAKIFLRLANFERNKVALKKLQKEFVANYGILIVFL